MQETRVQPLIWEDPTCLGAAKAVCHSYWACALQQEKPQQWEALALQQGVAPHSPQLEESPHSNEDPAQPNINKNF